MVVANRRIRAYACPYTANLRRKRNVLPPADVLGADGAKSEVEYNRDPTHDTAYGSLQKPVVDDGYP